MSASTTHEKTRASDETRDGNDAMRGPENGKDRESGQKPDGQDKKPRSRWPIVVLVIVVLLAAIGAGVYWFLTRNQESTDDAYTEGNAISIAPKVSGYVIERSINDNSFVKAGDLLLKIDPRDYIASRDQARASLAMAQAQLASAEVDLVTTRVRAPASLVQAKAQLAQSRANEMQARREYARQRAVDPRATTQNTKDQAASSFESSDAGVQSAQAQVNVAALVAETIRSAEDTVQQRQAQVAQAQANLAQADLNLSYTEIRAPQDGWITNRNVDVGTYAQAGQQVFYLVSPDVWIVANFKETQLDRMRPGQHVDIAVDSYPGLKLSGHIDSIQDGSGARFSAFPAENATGNYVKIVRRVPVKIIIDHGLEHWHFLPLGLSVEPVVYFP